jgi:hypothetical protein
MQQDFLIYGYISTNYERIVCENSVEIPWAKPKRHTLQSAAQWVQTGKVDAVCTIYSPLDAFSNLSIMVCWIASFSWHNRKATSLYSFYVKILCFIFSPIGRTNDNGRMSMALSIQISVLYSLIDLYLLIRTARRCQRKSMHGWCVWIIEFFLLWSGARVNQRRMQSLLCKYEDQFC